MSILKFAKKELQLLCDSAGPGADDRPIVEEFIPEKLVLIEKFANSGQSGGSAPYVANAICQTLKKLMLYKSLNPVTGEDEEWSNCADMGNSTLYQNSRCSALFKDSRDNKCWYLDAIVWKGDTEGESGNNWDTFTGSVAGITSRQYVKEFPFTPKTFYIDVHRVKYDPTIHDVNESISCGDGDYVYLIKDKTQLNEVFEYYNEYKHELKNK